MDFEAWLKRLAIRLNVPMEYKPGDEYEDEEPEIRKMFNEALAKQK